MMMSHMCQASTQSALLPGVNNMDVAGVTTPGAKSAWSEHKSPDGRTYYCNTETKQSIGEKLDDLKSPAEQLSSKCPGSNTNLTLESLTITILKQKNAAGPNLKNLKILKDPRIPLLLKSYYKIKPARNDQS